MSILGLDFGVKRLGLAISSGFLAQPLHVLPNNSKVFTNLKNICLSNKTEKIVIGIPEGKLRERVKEFAKSCQQQLGLDVEFEDEILTTVKAQSLLIQSRSTRAKRKRIVDAAAAAVILQQYLDRNQ